MYVHTYRAGSRPRIRRLTDGVQAIVDSLTAGLPAIVDSYMEEKFEPYLAWFDLKIEAPETFVGYDVSWDGSGFTLRSSSVNRLTFARPRFAHYLSAVENLRFSAIVVGQIISNIDRHLVRDTPVTIILSLEKSCSHSTRFEQLNYPKRSLLRSLLSISAWHCYFVSLIRAVPNRC